MNHARNDLLYYPGRSAKSALSALYQTDFSGTSQNQHVILTGILQRLQIHVNESLFPPCLSQSRAWFAFRITILVSYIRKSPQPPIQGGERYSPCRINLRDSNPVRGEMFIENGTTKHIPSSIGAACEICQEHVSHLRSLVA